MVSPPKSKTTLQTKLYPLFSLQQTRENSKQRKDNICDSIQQLKQNKLHPKPKPPRQQTVFTTTFRSKPQKKSLDSDDDDDDDDDSDDDSDDDGVPLSMLAMHRNYQPPNVLPKKRNASMREEESTMQRKNVVDRSEGPQRKKGGKLPFPFDQSSVGTSDYPTICAAKATTFGSDAAANPFIAKEDENRLDTTSARNSLSPPSKSTKSRIYSDCSMDFVPPADDHCRRSGSNNVLIQLLHRSVHGCLLHKTAGLGGTGNRIIHRNRGVATDSPAECPSWMVSPKWKIPSWVSLAPPIDYFRKNKCVDHFAWDAMGVLLAVASDVIISIYDWDMVRAADLQGRRDRSRHCRDSHWKIEPVLQFRTPSPVTKLLWNRFHQDELVVGLRVGGKVMVFDIDRLAQWLSKDSARQNQIPPERTYRGMDIPRFSGEIKEILLSDAENILVSTSNAMLYRYMFPKKSGVAATQIWRYQSASNVTSMAQIGYNLVVAGTVYGQICLLDWTRHSKERSFSRDQRPKILRHFVPHEALLAPREDILLGKRMGVLKLTTQTTNSSGEAGMNHWGRCRITWATQCGWLLTMELESPNNLSSCHVIHQTPTIIHKNADGTIIQTGKKSWSLPQHSVGVDFSEHCTICITDVPSVTKILTHHDKFVLDSQPNVIRSKKRSLTFYSDQGRQAIKLPKSIAAVPQSLTVHPNREWLIIGDGNQLHLLAYR
ncbi:hypothetical protein IV203_029710 [Nitzschia inconspicua]|uniref:Uncharacterized protein n=1 Tax=Nitzschia inconspicua TaxID=303405 RepID=A0A9K3LR65_9STRA|nr:hypothetical protein IV203_029710 [Nitzschia inconspicua]